MVGHPREPTGAEDRSGNGVDLLVHPVHDLEPKRGENLAARRPPEKPEQVHPRLRVDDDIFVHIPHDHIFEILPQPADEVVQKPPAQHVELLGLAGDRQDVAALCNPRDDVAAAMAHHIAVLAPEHAAVIRHPSFEEERVVTHHGDRGRRRLHVASLPHLTDSVCKTLYRRDRMFYI